MVTRSDVARELELRDQLVAAAEREASRLLVREQRALARKDRRRTLVARLLGRR